MAYTSVLPVHRLDRSIDYVKDRTKTTKSAGSLEEAIDYALNREKTEQTIFEDAMGCTCENAYADMVLSLIHISWHLVILGSVQRQVLFQLFGGFPEPYIPGSV